jgi:hypothetical protein
MTKAKLLKMCEDENTILSKMDHLSQDPHLLNWAKDLATKAVKEDFGMEVIGLYEDLCKSIIDRNLEAKNRNLRNTISVVLLQMLKSHPLNKSVVSLTLKLHIELMRISTSPGRYSPDNSSEAADFDIMKRILRNIAEAVEESNKILDTSEKKKYIKDYCKGIRFVKEAYGHEFELAMEVETYSSLDKIVETDIREDMQKLMERIRRTR